MTRTILAGAVACMVVACAPRRDTPERTDVRIDTAATTAPVVPMPDTSRDTLRNRVDSAGFGQSSR